MCTPDSENSSLEHGDLTSQLVGKQNLRLRGLGHTDRQGLARPPLHVSETPWSSTASSDVLQGHLSGSEGLGFCHSSHLPREHTGSPLGLGGWSRACLSCTQQVPLPPSRIQT